MSAARQGTRVLYICTLYCTAARVTSARRAFPRRARGPALPRPVGRAACPGTVFNSAIPRGRNLSLRSLDCDNALLRRGRWTRVTHRTAHTLTSKHSCLRTCKRRQPVFVSDSVWSGRYRPFHVWSGSNNPLMLLLYSHPFKRFGSRDTSSCYRLPLKLCVLIRY